MSKKESKKVNYYKYVTFVFIGLLLIFGLIYVFGAYRDSVYNEGFKNGQANTIGFVIDRVTTDGSVSFANEQNASLTLVPVQHLSLVREQTILEIMNYVETEGSVSLYNNETEMLLVESEVPVEQGSSNLDNLIQ